MQRFPIKMNDIINIILIILIMYFGYNVYVKYYQKQNVRDESVKIAPTISANVKLNDVTIKIVNN